ncbi:hypothetical protein ES708_20783 [subsurface metagenome]
MDRNSNKKLAILALLDEGETDLKLIASKVGCSEAWVREVARNQHKFLPATLEADLSLVEELASDFDGKDAFAGGVRWLGKSLMFACRLLGQVSAIPTMGRTGELQELIVLAQAMTPKPAPTDPALVASLTNVSQSIAKMASPKTPQMAMFEMMQPVLQGVIGNMMAAMGQKVPVAAQPGQPVEQATEADVDAAFGQPNINNREGG